MSILIRTGDPAEREVTPEALYLRRREFLRGALTTAGAVAGALLVPLAITSTRGWIRRLGRRWTTLHRLAYVAAVAAVVHYWWLVKADVRAPLWYAGVLATLFVARLAYRFRGFATAVISRSPQETVD